MAQGWCRGVRGVRIESGPRLAKHEPLTPELAPQPLRQALNTHKQINIKIDYLGEENKGRDGKEYYI